MRYYAPIICVTTYEGMLRAACAINTKLEIEMSTKTWQDLKLIYIKLYTFLYNVLFYMQYMLYLHVLSSLKFTLYIY